MLLHNRGRLGNDVRVSSESSGERQKQLESNLSPCFLLLLRGIRWEQPHKKHVHSAVARKYALPSTCRLLCFDLLCISPPSPLPQRVDEHRHVVRESVRHSHGGPPSKSPLAAHFKFAPVVGTSIVFVSGRTQVWIEGMRLCCGGGAWPQQCYRHC